MCRRQIVLQPSSRVLRFLKWLRFPSQAEVRLQRLTRPNPPPLVVRAGQIPRCGQATNRLPSASRLRRPTAGGASFSEGPLTQGTSPQQQATAQSLDRADGQSNPRRGGRSLPVSSDRLGPRNLLSCEWRETVC